MKTVFEKIISGELPSEVIYENDKILVINDINPQAPIHYLILPKKKYVNISDIPVEEMDIVVDMCKAAQILSINGKSNKSYRLLINNGSSAGQVVFYLHMHFLSWDV